MKKNINYYIMTDVKTIFNKNRTTTFILGDKRVKIKIRVMPLTYKQRFNRKHGQPINTSNSIKKIARLSGIKYTNALTIVKKGEGAYFSNPSSVRSHIKSPREWGIARLYSAVMGGKSSKIDKDLLN